VAHPLAVGLVLIIALGNLRGIKESGTIFSIPTYGFVVVLGATIVIGVLEVLFSDSPNIFAVGEPDKEPAETEDFAGLALSSSLSVRSPRAARRSPEWRRSPTASPRSSHLREERHPHDGSHGLPARVPLPWYDPLARHFGIVYEDGDTRRSCPRWARRSLAETWCTSIGITRASSSGREHGIYGLPILGSILARWLSPRVFHQRGNRLVFSYGILALTGFAILLPSPSTPQPLAHPPTRSACSCFTVAQAGMVIFWQRHKDDPGWSRSAFINGFGAVVTAVVFVIILVTKFAQGGFWVVVAIPVITAILWLIGRFYRSLHRALYVNPNAVLDLTPRGRAARAIVVPVRDQPGHGDDLGPPASAHGCHRGPRPRRPRRASTVEANWSRQFPDIPLVVIDSPFRTVLRSDRGIRQRPPPAAAPRGHGQRSRYSRCGSGTRGRW
jgi:hypothetical protein